MSYDIHDPIFTDEDQAREHLESVLWPDGPVCPRCKGREQIVKCKGAAYRPGLYHCKPCRRQFTVTIGTAYERSKIPLHNWLLATHLLCSSKKGMSAHQFHRMLGVTYKTAWFMAHRIRESMTDPSPEGLGGEGKTIEADETYFGHKEGRAEEAKKPEPGRQARRRGLGRARRQGSHLQPERRHLGERKPNSSHDGAPHQQANDRRKPPVHEGRRGIRLS